jgi:ribosomal protein L7/L12
LVRVGDERIDDAEIRDLIRHGRKIEAIKRMRDATGMGLAEAKDAVEAIERTLR